MLLAIARTYRHSLRSFLGSLRSRPSLSLGHQLYFMCVLLQCFSTTYLMFYLLGGFFRPLLHWSQCEPLYTIYLQAGLLSTYLPLKTMSNCEVRGDGIEAPRSGLRVGVTCDTEIVPPKRGVNFVQNFTAQAGREGYGVLYFYSHSTQYIVCICIHIHNIWYMYVVVCNTN